MKKAKKVNKVEVTFNKSHRKISEFMSCMDLGVEKVFVEEGYELTTTTKTDIVWMKKVKRAIQKIHNEQGFEAFEFKFKRVVENVKV